MSGRRFGSRWLAVAGAASAALAGSGSAIAASAGISLNRTPAPPQAAKVGAGNEQVTYTVNYDTRGSQVTVRIVTPSGVAVGAPVQVRNLTDDAPSAGRSITDTLSWAVPSGLAPGRYFAEVRFFSNGDTATPEATATAAFDVAPQLGQLRISKWEDNNGNGVRDAGEPGLPGWSFSLLNPFGGASGAQTGADGSVFLTDVPAGTWQVAETLQAGWIPVTVPSGTAIVPPDGIGAFAVGNVRPAVLSGTVFVDVNKNGVIDAGEIGKGGVTLTLTGNDGLGRVVTSAGTSAADGTYTFGNLLPGTYTVASGSVPLMTYTTPTTIGGLVLTSGGNRPKNDFGVVNAPPVVLAGNPAPTALGINKQGPATLTPGRNFRYRITVRNTGKAAARNVVVTDPVPSLITVVQVPSTASLVNGVLAWRLGTLAPGASRQVSVLVRLSSGAPAGTYRNDATADADNTAPVVGSTTGTVKRPTPKATRAGGVTG